MRTHNKSTPSKPRSMITVREASEILGIPAQTIYRQINNGTWRKDIRAFKTGTVVRINAFDVDRVAGPGDAA